jgi:ribosomal protein L29
MKKKDLTEMKSKTLAELRKVAVQKRVEANNAGMKISAGKEKNLKSFKNLRREIAQILTIIKEKEIVEKLQPGKEKTLK